MATAQSEGWCWCLERQGMASKDKIDETSDYNIQQQEAEDMKS